MVCAVDKESSTKSKDKGRQQKQQPKQQQQQPAAPSQDIPTRSLRQRNPVAEGE